jgi:hypothetical protein
MNMLSHSLKAREMRTRFLRFSLWSLLFLLGYFVLRHSWRETVVLAAAFCCQGFFGAIFDRLLFSARVLAEAALFISLIAAVLLFS